MLWVYITPYKKLTRQTTFKLVYGIEAVMLMEYIVPIFCIVAFTGMADHGALEERLTQLKNWKKIGFWLDSISKFKWSMKRHGTSTCT